MAEIEFQRRGRPLWVVLLVVLIAALAGYFGWSSCAALNRQKPLAPRTAPTAAPVVPPSAPAPAPAPAPR